ncbi:ABC transporter substrate-binding protein [Mesorhizobium sp. M0013]|uniref:ABC transporter substrate-binding protein n=1 Tax=Mesorhizobium sp. M0013 TaxID=2956841 RepID=UPI00333C729C
MKKLMLVSMMVSALTLVGGAATAQQKTISVVVKDTTSPYWQTVMAGACVAGKDLGVTVNVTGPQSEADVNGQIGILENAVSTGSSAIVLAPTSFDALGPAVDEAAAKVPVFLIDSKAKSDAYTSILATDNKAGGVLAGKAMADALTKKNGAAKGSVGVISYGAGASTLDERIAGFTEGLAAYPDIKVVTKRVGDFQTTTALNDTNDVLTAFPKIDGLYGDALFTGLGAGQAISESNRKGNPVLVTFDSSDTLEQYIRDGVAQALVVQNPYKMGYGGVENAVKALNGDKLPKFIDTGVMVITPDNVGSPEAQALLHPDVSCLKK